MTAGRRLQTKNKLAAVTTIKSKPSAKELTFKTDEAGSYFDGFIYEGANLQEKNSLGSLYVIGQVKYSDEDLAYLVNLIASLAKREYYAGTASQTNPAKTAFENTLKKLNEVLEDFFKNKKFKLTIGLAAIAADNIYISRLGNVRFALARDGHYVDVINNIGLFNRERVEEKEFSNVISGKIQHQDKLFMYLPLRPVISREKSLRELFKKEAQVDFAEKLANLSQSTANFACCGIHIEMNNIKEIPIEVRPSYYTTLAVAPEEDKPTQRPHRTKEPTVTSDPEPPPTNKTTEDSEADLEEDSAMTTPPEPLPQPRIIPADVSLARRKSFVTKLTGFWGGGRPRIMIPKTPKNLKLSGLVVAGIVVVGLVAYLSFFRSSGPDAALIKQAKTDLKTIKDSIAKNDYRTARSLGYASLANLLNATSKQAVDVRQQLASSLTDIDKTSDKQAVVFAQDPGQTNLLRITNSSDGKLYLINTDGSVFSASEGSQSFQKVGDTVAKNAQYLLDGDKLAAIAGSTLAILNKKTDKTDSYALKGFDGTKDIAFYEGNIYALGNGSIVKYNDVVTTEAKPAVWGKDLPATAQALTVDGSLYLLGSDGKVGVYFKGAKQNEFDLALTPSADARIFTAKDMPFLYYVDKSARRVMVFDKTNGELKTSYSLNSAAGELGTIADISVAKDQSIFILSSNGKVWVLK